MADCVKDKNSNHASENSLLKSMLFLMTPEQKEFFLNISASRGIIYANKSPRFKHPLSVSLTQAACHHLFDILNGKPGNSRARQPLRNEQTCIDILKTDLENGVKLSGNLISRSDDKNNKEDLNIRVKSRLFVMSCYPQIEKDGRSLLKATYIGSASAADAPKSDSTEDEDTDSDSFSGNQDLTTFDMDSISQKSVAAKPETFYPHVITSWHIYTKSSAADIRYFDLEALEKLICEISINRKLSGIYYWKRKHLKDLADVVNLCQLAMQYRYETDKIYSDCKLIIEDPNEEIINIKRASAYEDEETADDPDDGNDYRRIERLLRCRMKKPVFLVNEGYAHGCCVFSNSKGQTIPTAGFLADVGLESVIKKENDAISSLANQSNSVHLTRLGMLLGEIKTEELEPFICQDNQIELVDKLLSGSQKEAVVKAISTPDICLIQGPPGTGKTRVISEIIRQAARNDWKTLLVAPTHVAVDNVLERIGFEDNIGAVRCASKDKLDNLDEHIREFTYDQRKKTLITHAQMRVKNDIERLSDERKQLENTCNLLHELCLRHKEAAGLSDELKKHRELLSSTPETIREQYKKDLTSRNSRITCTDNLLSESQKDLDSSVQSLKKIKENANRFKAEHYKDEELERIKQAVAEADNLHGNTFRRLRDENDQTQKNIEVLNQKIQCEKTKLQNTKTILSQINAGSIPDIVKEEIINAVKSAAADCDRDIADKAQTLKNAHQKLQENQQHTIELKEIIEKINLRLAEREQNQLKSRWSRPLDLIWWKSLFVDYDLTLSNHADQLEDSLKLIPSLKLAISDAAAALEKTKADKNTVLQSTKKSEFIRQCNLYRHFYESQTKELASLNQQLQNENDRLLSLSDAIKTARYELDQILSTEEKSVKKEIRKEFASKIKNTRRKIIECQNQLKASYKMSLEAHLEAVKLEHDIIQAIMDESGRLKLQIDTLSAGIQSNGQHINDLEKQVQGFLDKKLPDKINAIKKIISQIGGDIETNQTLADFSKRWLDYLSRDSGFLTGHLADYINLVCATTIGIASDEYFGDDGTLGQKKFDLLIVDEAGKVTEPEFLVAAARAKRWVIVGDHKQLPPYYDRKLDKVFKAVNRLRKDKDMPSLNPELLQISYFENLWKKLCRDKSKRNKADSRFVQLDVQRRMHPDLACFISDMFYDSRYQSPEEPAFIKDKTLKLPRFNYAVTLIEVCPGPKQKPFEVNLSRDKSLKLPQKTGYANLKEAKKVIEVLTGILMDESIFSEQEKLKKENDSTAAIGIMAFYGGQVELIRRLIKSDSFLEAVESGGGQFLCKGKVTVAVNSVDSFQGKECPVIILSFTRSNPYKNIGFVDDANRLNVAMSRARKKLILIGDTATFTNRAKTEDSKIKGSDSGAIRAERLFFEKLVEYIEGRGEIKKVFQLLDN